MLDYERHAKIIKEFCKSFDIKNIFHINCRYFEHNKELINFNNLYANYNHHAIEYCYDEYTFPDIDYSIKKTIDISFSGVAPGPGPGTTTIRQPFLEKIKSTCVSNGYIYKFLINKRYKTIKEYSRSMLESKICIDTVTEGGHISARMWEIPYHKSAIMVIENEIYDGILKDGVNCIIIKKDFSDLEDKLIFYLENPSELNKIIDHAYREFNEKHTTEQRIKYMLRLIK
jgi:hypothetical protein